MPRLLPPAAACAALLLTASAPAFADEPVPPTSPDAVRAAVADIRPAELELLRRTNAYRASLGLRPLLVSARLQREARWYARDMAAHDGFTITHIDSLGRDLWTRLADFGYRDERAAQNSGAGSPDGDAMFEALKASVPHDRTMRGADFVVTSVAAAENPAFPSRWYWAATFGTVDDRPRFDALIAVPEPPRLDVARCAHGRKVLLRAFASAPTRAIELQVRGRGGRWSRVRHIAAARVCVRVPRGARARARAVAYPAVVAGADRGAWRAVRGPLR